ncbi:MAG: hypothetical protein OXR64_02060 [Chloroflexota bacterium]|nr:hypothetical protein [Chloroflexota bacterium]MDE2918615.1 hypothetical protein [Chloroflexota bacterium]
MAERQHQQRDEFARRLRAYMGYADRTLDDIARSLHAAGVSASVSTINRWSRGQSIPNIVAAQALGHLVEQAGLAGPGEGVAWLLGAGPLGPPFGADAAPINLDRAVRSWQFNTAGPALAEALAERGVPPPYRQPLADLLAQLLTEIEPEDSHLPLADRDANR